VPQDTILPETIARKLLRRTFDLYHGGRGMVVVQFEGMAMTALKFKWDWWPTGRSMRPLTTLE
jgi:hypothetical protein